MFLVKKSEHKTPNYTFYSLKTIQNKILSNNNEKIFLNQKTIIFN